MTSTTPKLYNNPRLSAEFPDWPLGGTRRTH